VKVLDFGLAKAIEPATAPSQGLSASPTITTPAMTRAGEIVGTAAYMSPEQARGKAVDRRADIWAFGAVVYEMLTARRAFTGSDVQETLAAILRDEPDWSALPRETPARIRRALQLCLRKDPHQRVRDVVAIRLAMEGAFETEAPTTLVRRSLPQGTLPWIAAVVMSVATGLAVAWILRSAASPPVARFIALLETPERRDPSTPALSPNGEYLAYTSGLGGARSLSLHRVAELDAKPIIEIEGARFPFFSPDSAWLGFFVGNELKKVSVRGGPPQTVARVPAGRGASWGADGHIVFAPSFRSGLSRVSADGGTVEAVTTLNPRLDESGHRNPVLLPGSRAIIYTLF
jgi:serine/threonine protein kinase